ncbi:MAG: hypothetical protein JNL05_03780 [Flavobacteriales bacterium]|nr:hypothetical protein [Flavobacteriales bacterium]
MKQVLLALVGSAILLGCGGGSGSGETGGEDSTAVAAPTNTLDLAAHDLPLVLNLPDKQLLGGAEAQVVWKDQVGLLEVRAGEHFGLTIIEEPGDIARKKADLDRDLLRKNTILKETPELLVYRSEFPDDPSLVYIRFHQLVRAGDRSFVVEDIPELKFNEQDVERMTAAVAPKQPA